MLDISSARIFRALLYGGGSALLILDVFFLLRALLLGEYVPLVPVIAGIFTAGGLLILLFAEQRAREEDKRDHARVSRVAHQLTGPLKILQEDLASLLKQADQLPDSARLKIKRMDTRTTILLENIRDVFMALQAQTGKIAQDVHAHDLCVLMQEAYERAKPLAAARNVELTYDTHCAKAPVRVDRRLMLIAVAHVIENAIIYTRTPGRVNIAVTRGQRRIRIIVRDRGIGISAADAPQVLRPFARGTRAQQYDADGIGLGLALTHLIVREFGGRLTWRSVRGRAGSQFELQLPLHIPQ
jgi:signal transduction histidine kinase